MLVTRQRVFRKFWHPVIPFSQLQCGTPQPFTLLGEAIVPWLDADGGEPRALKDRCCHRTAKLSKRRCVNNPPAFHGVSGSTEPITQRCIRNAYFLPLSRRLDIEYPSGVRHVIVKGFSPIDDGHIQLCQWLFRNDTEADCPAQMLIDFDHVITREDKDILESTDPDAVVDLRRRGVEFSVDSDRPGILIRKQLMALLARHGENEIHREVHRQHGRT